MVNPRNQLMTWLSDESEEMIGLLKDLLRAKSPNPPGDTRVAVEVVSSYLEKHDLDYRIIAPCDVMPNLVASFDAPISGRHLVLNGHIDVFPVPADEYGWSSDPWAADERDKHIAPSLAIS